MANLRRKRDGAESCAFARSFAFPLGSILCSGSVCRCRVAVLGRCERYGRVERCSRRGNRGDGGDGRWRSGHAAKERRRQIRVIWRPLGRCRHSMHVGRPCTSRRDVRRATRSTAGGSRRRDGRWCLNLLSLLRQYLCRRLCPATGTGLLPCPADPARSHQRALPWPTDASFEHERRRHRAVVGPCQVE